jgi:hypothetical protein
MSSLRSFLDEVRAAPEVQRALAAGTVIDGASAAEHMVAMELLFNELVYNPSEAAIGAHDAVLKIINSSASMKQRLLACRRELERRQLGH